MTNLQSFSESLNGILLEAFASLAELIDLLGRYDVAPMPGTKSTMTAMPKTQMAISGPMTREEMPHPGKRRANSIEQD